jgi:hypothetical protein
VLDSLDHRDIHRLAGVPLTQRRAVWGFQGAGILGQGQPHRLNRGGDRLADPALHAVGLTRVRGEPAHPAQQLTDIDVSVS